MPRAAILRRPLVADADRHRQQRLPPAAGGAARRRRSWSWPQAHRLVEPPRRLARRQQGAVHLRLPLVPLTRTSSSSRKTGKFVLQIGTPGKMDGPDSHDTLNAPQAVAVDDAANEVYVADSGNKRIVVFDANTGAYKRALDRGGLEAVRRRQLRATRQGRQRLRVRQREQPHRRVREERQVREGRRRERGNGRFVLGGAGGAQGTIYSFGSVWDIAFSNDAQQRFLYVADGMNKTVWIVQRDTLTPVSRFGEGGRYAGPLLRGRQRRGRFEGERLHGRRRATASACRSGSTKAWAQPN